MEKPKAIYFFAWQTEVSIGNTGHNAPKGMYDNECQIWGSVPVLYARTVGTEDRGVVERGQGP